MNKKNNLISLLVAILIIITLTGCSKEQKSTPKPPLVKTIIAEQADSVNKNVYAGVVRGRYESNLSFQVGGRILSRNVQAGSFVRAGDALITLDQRDVIQQANQGDAQVTSRAAELELAKSNLSRYKELYDAGAVSASVLEQYQTNYNVALAAYENAKAQAAQSHNALDYAYLTANADGVVSDVFVEVGQVVAAGQTALSLVQAKELEVEIYVPENYIQDAIIGNNAQINFWAIPGENITGVIREVSPTADAASRTYAVRLSLPNPPQNLKLGMTASVSLLSSDYASSDLCTLPLSAVYQSNNQTQVWTVNEDNKLELKNISVEEFGDNEVRVKGLSNGERVVTAGVHNLRVGEEVRFKGEDL